jgi:RimJ/RimL family protein N-acetyltransferase
MSHPFPVTIEQEKDWIEKVLLSKNDIFFGIETNTDKELIGLVKLSSIDWLSRTCKFGIYIGSYTQRGKGYGEQSIKLIITYVRETLNLRKLKLEVLTDNKNAINLYKKMGFVEIGINKEEVFSFNKYYDTLLMYKII